MNIPFVVETVLHDGLLKYKFKNSKIQLKSLPSQVKVKGLIFAYRSKKKHDWRTWRCSDFRRSDSRKSRYIYALDTKRLSYGTYADENRSYTKGHSENNLRQINTFFIDFDIHTAKETISASDILTTAIDLGFMLR